MTSSLISAVNTPMTPRKTMRQRAFTLIEMIVVLAITAVLLTIIFIPMIQGFTFTRAAQGFADAQDKARQLSEKISREIGEAAAVRDPSGIGGTVFVRLPIPQQALDENGARITPANAGTIVPVALQYSKLDLIPPAEGEPTRGPGGAFINPNTGKEDPTLAAPKGQVTLPLAPGTRLVRYWVGLRDPFRPYTNPYDGLLMARTGARDNLYVLFRAEVEPVVTRNGATTSVVVNGDYFDLDPNDASGRTPLYDDPSFFLPNVINGTIQTNDAKAIRIGNWLRRAVVQTEVSRYDSIAPEYDLSSRLVKLDANGKPKLLPLVQFRPDRIANDPAEGQTALQLGSEANGALNIGPEVFRTKFGAWSNGVVRVYPRNWQLEANNTLYSVAKEYTDAASKRRYGIFGVDAGVAQSDTDPATGTLLFDSTQYLEAVRAGRRFPFSEALNAADTASGWLGGANSARLRALFTPFVVDGERGQVTASFGVAEIGPATGNPVAPALQLPSGPANSYMGANANISYTPANDPIAGSGSGVFSDTDYASVNARFNKLWLDAQAGRNGVPSALSERGVAERFIDLRVTPTGDNIASPLDPRLGFPRTRIVPGSEEVYGPDATAGPNYGYEVRYHRTTNPIPGPNEYAINYVDLPEPDYGVTFGTANPPGTYDATSLVSAVIQPRFKAGYLKLCSEPNLPIPAQTLVKDNAGVYQAIPTRIRVNYRFQMTDAADVVAVDYDTRSLISVLLTIRNNAQTNLPNPPSVSLKATATARNILR